VYIVNRKLQLTLILYSIMLAVAISLSNFLGQELIIRAEGVGSTGVIIFTLGIMLVIVLLSVFFWICSDQ